MDAPHSDCCALDGGCGGSPERKEPPVATANTARQPVGPGLHERPTSHHACSDSTCHPPSITIPSSGSAAPESPHQTSSSSCRHCDSPYSDSSTETRDVKPPNSSRSRSRLNCFHKASEPPRCESPLLTPRLPVHSMAHHHHHGSDHHHHGSDHHKQGADHEHGHERSNTDSHADTGSTLKSVTCCSGSEESHSHADTGGTHKLDTCCSGSDDHVHIQDVKQPDAYTDIDNNGGEGGPASFERVVLTVGGLKCGCCETGLSKALQQIPAIKYHQVNVVLARVEFELNTSRLSIPEVISRLNKTTGYTFQHHNQPEGQILELLVSDPSEILRAGRPYGVSLLGSQQDKALWGPSLLFSGRSSAVPPEVSNFNPQQQLSAEHQKTPPSLFMHTVMVHYDAKLIGARDVFEYYQQLAPSQNLQLAPLGAHSSLSVGAKQVKRACRRFFVTLVFTIPVLVFAWAPVNRSKMPYAPHVSLALATVVQAIATKEFVPGALQSLIHSGLFEMDFLIAMSSTLAYVFSVVSYVFMVKGHPLETGSFFETSTLLVTLILLGRAVNEFARLRAAKSVSIRSLQKHDALLLRLEDQVSLASPGNATSKIDARLLQYGDYFKVLPHTRIVTDGNVVYGGSEVDESMITGESIPVAKGLGQKVHAGTMNGSGELVIELTKLPHENSISRIATMVENAELSKPKVQALADKIAGWFAPVIAAIGSLVFLIWVLVDRYQNHRSWKNAVVKAITYAIATLVVSCPCAIGLAVPMVVLIAGGTAARFGIIFRDPQKIEVARNTTDVVFDKTGTLTTGEMLVVEGQLHEAYHKQIEGMILGLLEEDKHPVAAAVVKWLKAHPSKDGTGPTVPMKMHSIKSEPGNGVMGICEESQLEVRAGNPVWLDVSVLESQHTILCVTVSGVLNATFRLEDQARHGADNMVGLLAVRSIKVHMISGDGQGPVNKIAHDLNIPKNQTRSRLKPVDKQRYVHELQKEGKVVLFCGDGTNDSPALKQADVGVHMNDGSDVAKGASDVVFMSTDLHDILILLDISKAAYTRIITNFAWSGVYNVLAVLLAAGAFVKVRIPPAYAGLGELVSVLPVVFIAFQMKWRDYGKKYRVKDVDLKE